MRERTLAIWLLGCSLLVTPLAAQVAPTFPELLRDAQGRSARITANDADVDAARGQARQADTRPNPTLRTEVENFAGRQPFDRFDQAETTVSVEQAFELGGKRSARTAAAIAEVRTAQARADQDRAQFAYDLAVAYATTEAQNGKLLLAREGLSLAEADARVARLLFQNGREARVRSVQADAATASARGDVATAEAEAEAALARLNALAMLSEPIAAISGGLLAAEPAIVSDGLRDSPAVLVARTEREAAERRIRSERALATPDVTVSLGARRLEGDNATAMVAGLSIPLPFFNRNRGGVESASASARAAEARLAQVAADAEADRLTARSKARAADARVTAAIEGEAAAGEAYRLARIGYEGGKMPLIELLGARRALVDAKARAIDARLARVQALADIARLQGQSLSGPLL